MTDKVNPSINRPAEAFKTAGAMAYGGHGGNEDYPGFVVDGAEPTEISTQDSGIDETALNSFAESSSTGSFDVTIDPGEAFVYGSWLAIDASTTITLASGTNNQVVYAGWNKDGTDDVIVGLSSSFQSASGNTDIKIPLWSFDTDGSGVTSSTDERRVGYSQDIDGKQFFGSEDFSIFYESSQDELHLVDEENAVVKQTWDKNGDSYFPNGVVHAQQGLIVEGKDVSEFSRDAPVSSWQANTFDETVLDITTSSVDASGGNISFEDGIFDYTGTSYDLSGTQGTGMEDLSITFDGTNWFTTDDENSTVFEYDSDFNPVTTHDISGNTGISDGIEYYNSAFWIIDASNNEIDEYNTSFTYQASYDISGQTTAPEGLTHDGTNWLLVGSNNTVYQYDDSWSYQSVSYDLSSEVSSIQDVAFFDGSYWVAGGGEDRVYRYDDSFNYTGNTYDLQDTFVSSLYYNASDGFWYVSHWTGNEPEVYQHTSNATLSASAEIRFNGTIPSDIQQWSVALVDYVEESGTVTVDIVNDTTDTAIASGVSQDTYIDLTDVSTSDEIRVDLQLDRPDGAENPRLTYSSISWIGGALNYASPNQFVIPTKSSDPSGQPAGAIWYREDLD